MIRSLSIKQKKKEFEYVAQVFVDPFAEAKEQLAAERAEELKRKSEGSGVKPKKATKQPLKIFRDGVGKYLNLQEVSNSKKDKSEEVPSKKSKKDANYNFGSFDSW
ncbi:hypothetical protein ACJJTC_009491 [Scirpophaga incertulas]